MKNLWLFTLVFSLAAPVLPQQGGVDRAELLNEQAIGLAEQRKFEEALRLFEQAHRLDPSDENLGMNRVSMLTKLRRHQEALSLVQQLLRRHPESDELKALHISMLHRLEWRSEALYRQLERAMETQGPGALSGLAPLEDHITIQAKALKPRPDEIRLEGFFSNYTRGQLELEAMVFTVPAGRSSLLPQRKIKGVSCGNLEPEYGIVGAVPWHQLRRGDFMMVLGRQLKDRFMVRRILVATRTRAEEEQRGSIFNSADIKVKENQDYPDIDERVTGRAELKVPKGPPIPVDVMSFVRDGGKTALLTTLSSVDSEAFQNNPDLAPLKSILATTQIHGLKGKPSNLTINLSTPFRLHYPPSFPFGGILAADFPSTPASLPLAPQSPQRGEVVYLCGWFDSDPGWIEGVVSYSDKDRLFVHTQSGGEEMRSAGSLILNRSGEVVGIQVAGSEEYVSAVSTDALRRAIHANN